MLSQFSALNSSQETLTTLAADTGGEAFTDSNDFGPAFVRVQRDMSAYYLIGYSSTNDTQDGKFRRINVRLRTPGAGYRLDARNGYYAAADFAHLGRDDRERQLQEQIASAVSLTDVPVVASTSWFRLENNRFYVPVSIAVAGKSAAPRMECRGEFLHAFLNKEVVKSNQPVQLIRGKDKFTADTMDFNNIDQVMLLQGRVKGLLVPGDAK